MFDTAQLLAMFVGLFVPILNGLLTRYGAVKGRVFLQLILNAAAGFGAEWLDHLNSGTDYNVGQAAFGALLALITSIAVQAGVWAPLGVSEAAKRNGVGASSSPSGLRFTHD
jgi:hypothetical protein